MISSMKTEGHKELVEKKKDPKPNSKLNPLSGVKQDEENIYNWLIKSSKYRGTLQFGDGLLSSLSKK
jgi:hypothetical protein